MTRTIFWAVLVSLASASAADLTGQYAGTYTSDNGGDGKLRLTIAKAADAWSCKLVYSTADQAEVNAQNFSCAVRGGKLTGEYDVSTDGGTARISLEAVLTGNSLEGTYKESGPDGKPADSGKWKAVPTK